MDIPIKIDNDSQMDVHIIDKEITKFEQEELLIEISLFEHESNEIPLEINGSSEFLEFTIESGGGSGDRLPYYTGDYEVTPSLEETVLETENKSMKKDVVINAIKRSETTNPSGGSTFTIG